MEADLVVMGSRGHGTIATMLLGGAGVGDRRSRALSHSSSRATATWSPVAFADDGSRSARNAEGVFTHWPIFAGMPVSVVTVAETAVPVAAGFTPGPVRPGAGVLHELRGRRASAGPGGGADSAARRLADAGLEAVAVALEGDPGGRDRPVRRGSGAIGTIVMGTRGHTACARLILGSVARNVLLHASCSVLIVRQGR